jgi:hypothetical protein
MKKQFNRFTILALGVLLVLAMPGCDANEKDDLPSHEGQQELRSAMAEFKGSLDRMNESPALMALNILGSCFRIDNAVFSEDDIDNMPAALRQLTMMTHLVTNPHQIPLPGNHVIFAVASYSAAETIELPIPGVYQYNFNTGRFDLLNPYVENFEFRFPSSAHNKNAGERDAIFRLDQLVTYPVSKVGGEVEKVPIMLEASLLIGDEVVLETIYRLTLSENGNPSMVLIHVDAPPYTIHMNYSGSSNRFNLVAKVREEDEDLIGINMNVDLCAENIDVDLANGMIVLGPLKIDGRIQPIDIFGCELDLAKMNNLIHLDVRQAVPHKLIGTIQFRTRSAPSLNIELPELAIVYGDGTHEFLADVFAEIFSQ